MLVWEFYNLICYVTDVFESDKDKQFVGRIDRPYQGTTYNYIFL